MNEDQIEEVAQELSKTLSQIDQVHVDFHETIDKVL